jgi:hypothetical protein
MAGSNSKMLQILLKWQLPAPNVKISPKCNNFYGKLEVPTPKCCNEMAASSSNMLQTARKTRKKTYKKTEKHNSQNNSGRFIIFSYIRVYLTMFIEIAMHWEILD